MAKAVRGQKQEDVQRLLARSRELERATEETRRLVREQLGRSLSLERTQATVKNELASMRQQETKLKSLRASGDSAAASSPIFLLGGLAF